MFARFRCKRAKKNEDVRREQSFCSVNKKIVYWKMPQPLEKNEQ
jgi:hypothetical protein